MIVEPWPLTDGVWWALLPSIEAGKPVTRDQVEGWLQDAVGCVWRIGDDACALTFANDQNEVEIVACGGRNSWRAIGPFEKHMKALPEHSGKTLFIEGRKAWARLLPDWERVDLDDGTIQLRLAV